MSGKRMSTPAFEKRFNPFLGMPYQSIQKMKAFTPPSDDRRFLFAQLAENIENAAMKARRYQLAPRSVVIFLRTEDFRDLGPEVGLSRPTAFPNEIIGAIEPAFDALFRPGVRYCSTGVVLLHLEEPETRQLDLFSASVVAEKMARLYAAVDTMREQYGKHTLFLGASFHAHQARAHEGARGTVPLCQRTLLPGERPRRRLGIPMFLGEVA